MHRPDVPQRVRAAASDGRRHVVLPPQGARQPGAVVGADEADDVALRGGVDEDFGPLFLKFCSYFPYNAKLCINGHEYLKRQLAKRGVAFDALDNGVLSCAYPALMQQSPDPVPALAAAGTAVPAPGVNMGPSSADRWEGGTGLFA